MAELQFQPAVTKRASEIIVEQIRERILRGELKPGDRLPSERNMMEMFQRSRPTVREALRMLERGGYIRTIAGSNGALVLEPNNSVQKSIQEAMQIGHISLGEMYEYRCVNEIATVVWACQRRTEENLAKLRDCLERTEQTREDPLQFIDLDSEYHRLIAEAAKNSVSILMTQTVSNIIRNFLRTKLATMAASEQREMLAKGLELHQQIYKAVELRDEKLAEEKMRMHLKDFEMDLRVESKN